MSDTISITDGAETWGTLGPSHYIPVKGAHPKAEMAYLVYQLALHNQVLPGTFFPDFVVAMNQLLITEAWIELSADGSGVLIKTDLVQVDLETGRKKTLSTKMGGMITPLRTEGANIIYSKADLNGSIIQEFEQAIVPLCP